jgi:hypothetical protein
VKDLMLKEDAVAMRTINTKTREPLFIDSINIDNKPTSKHYNTAILDKKQNLLNVFSKA